MGVYSSLYEGLTEEQKVKYRKQALGVAIWVTLLEFALVVGVIHSIEQVFFYGTDWTASIFYIAIAIIFLEKFWTVAITAGREVELIKERIRKRTKKNRKQQERE